jgi:hypothetical protein
MGHFKVYFEGVSHNFVGCYHPCLPWRRTVQPSNGLMSSQSDNVVTFVWPPVQQGIELETRSKILSLRRGMWNLKKKSLTVKTFAAAAKIRHRDQ